MGWGWIGRENIFRTNKRGKLKFNGGEALELKELTEKTLDLLKIENINEMSKKLFDVSINNCNDTYENFCDLVENDLSIDWLQKIYQYYQADRKEKMQDYTPQSLAKFVALLSGESDNVIDMCAGSGALTIQKWNLNHNQKFLLYEIDKNVIPFLLFNMSVRNIECIVCHADVLQQEVFKTWEVKKGEKFGKVKEVKNETHFNF